jgi:hypothetical protein
MQERLQRARPLGVDLVQTISRFVPPDTAFDLPAPMGEVGHPPGAEPGQQIREEDTRALGRVDTNETEGVGDLLRRHHRFDYLSPRAAIRKAVV